jgi:hypothetical protein
MGAGKTTVVAPLLALMLADGDSLVLSVVPKALLEMSRKQMRETFSTIMSKRIYTLTFDRGTVVTPATNRSLTNAKKNRGVVVATPTTLKSVQLVYVETMQRLDEARRTGPKDRASALADQLKELKAVLQTFRESVLLLDEVDMVRCLFLFVFCEYEVNVVCCQCLTVLSCPPPLRSSGVAPSQIGA